MLCVLVWHSSSQLAEPLCGARCSCGGGAVLKASLLPRHLHLSLAVEAQRLGESPS